MSADEIAIRNVIDVYWAEYAAANDPPDPDREALLKVLGGSMRDVVRQNLAAKRQNGQIARRPEGGPVKHATHFVEMKGATSALAVECVTDDTVVFVGATGAVVNDDTRSRFLNTELVLGTEGWAIHERSLQEELPGRALCGF